MKKSFVSVAFYGNKIQIVQLNSQKNKVEKFASVPLPDGLIVNYRIARQEEVTKIIVDTWKRLGLKHKLVGIVVPEFSTFTKLVDIPDLQSGELSEAVKWKSQDFLPGQGVNMVMDWQIVGNDKGKIQILSAAIQKDVLAGYIDAIGKADLLPLVVETPSLSLVRIADGDEGKLILYREDEDILLIVAKKEIIIGSSVVKAGDEQNAILTAGRISKFYQEAEVKKVLIAGLNITQSFIKNLQSTVSENVEYIAPKIEGLTPAQVQEYLIPLSLQMKDPMGPESEETINLLPPGWVRHYREKLVDVRAWTISLVVSVIVWASFLGTLGMFVFLNAESRSLKADAATVNPNLDSKVIKEVGRVNTLTQKVTTILDQKVAFQDIVNSLEQTVPERVVINKYQIVLDEGLVVLSGSAQDRTALINLRQALDDNKDFSAPSIPPSSLTQESNIEFALKFTYLKAASPKAPTIKLQL